MKQAICKAAALVLATSAALTLFPGKARAQTGATHGVFSVGKTGHSVDESASRVLLTVQDGRRRIVQ
ncbi:hypothetical protein [Cupriavidus necator]|uniref:hypothetical protein n=1 Tax=Cupriavidus necator TaxID=106590 RepID=UPI00099283C2|nr:hypothetical protein [Cupriavidus necator]